MWRAKRLRIYLEDAIRADAAAGRIAFFALLRTTFEARGWTVAFRPLTPIQRIRSARLPGFSLFHMARPWHPRALYLRRAYAEDHWRIEASHHRRDWSATRAAFDPATIAPEAAARCFAAWRRRMGADTAPTGPREPFIYVPLQGRLTQKRRFQSMAPLAMVDHLLAETDRPLCLTLHPRERHSRAERRALAERLAQKRVTLTEAPMHSLLARTAFVATQNSSVAFWGLLHKTPALLYADADFHHPFASIRRDGLSALDAATQPLEAPEAYLTWFFTRHTHTASEADPTPRLIERFQSLGWPL